MNWFSKTALIFVLVSMLCPLKIWAQVQTDQGAITRGSIAYKKLALVFTGDEFGDGAAFIAKTLRDQQINGSFFLTGNFYRNNRFKQVIQQLKHDGNYMGTHSDQ